MDRLFEWGLFNHKVVDHIRDYTIPQYGDGDTDQASGFDIDDLKKHLIRYCNRIGVNARGKTEALRDCIKIAHYACILYSKVREE